MQFPNNIGDGAKLGDRDLKICRRLLFSLYNQYPASVQFRDCTELNFKEYLDVIKEPIALDVIKERLDKDNPEGVSFFIYKKKKVGSELDSSGTGVDRSMASILYDLAVRFPSPSLFYSYGHHITFRTFPFSNNAHNFLNYLYRVCGNLSSCSLRSYKFRL